MAKKLTNLNSNSSHSGSRLTKSNAVFKLCIQEKLDNRYCFSCMKPGDLKVLDKFLGDTVEKHLTISEVDKLFLRTRGGVKSKEVINGVERDVVHYGKDRKKFRLHGYFNSDGYFVIVQIDPKHEKHKQA